MIEIGRTLIRRNLPRKCEFCGKDFYLASKLAIHCNTEQNPKFHFFCSVQCKLNYIYKLQKRKE